MKNFTLSILVIIGMMFANVLTAQVNGEMFDMTIANWTPALKVNTKAIKDIRAGLTSNDPGVQNETVRQYTVIENRTFQEVKFLHPTDANATQLVRLNAHDTTIDIMSLKMDKLTGDPSLKGQTLPLLAISRQDTQPYFIMGYTNSSENVVASKKPSKNEESEVVSMMDTKPAQTSQELALGEIRSVDGKSYTYMGKDSDGYPSWAPFDQTVIASSAHTQLEIKKKSKREMAEEQARQAAIADTARRTASYSLSVTQQGDPNLLASAGTVGKNQQPPQSGNGVNRYQIDGRWYYDDPVTGVPVPIKGQPKAMTLKPNQVLLDGDGDVAMQERAREKQKVHRLYDLQTNAPTSGSARAVEARSDWFTGGRAVVVTPVGGFYGGYSYSNNGYYNQPNNNFGYQWHGNCH